MTEMKKHIYDKSNGLWYELIGDYYIPVLALLHLLLPLPFMSPMYEKFNAAGEGYQKMVETYRSAGWALR